MGSRDGGRCGPAAGNVAACRHAHEVHPHPFTLGIACGFPTPDGIVLWTRLAPEPRAPGGGMSPEPVAFTC